MTGFEALSSILSHLVEYTGGDSNLGRQVRFGAAVALVGIAVVSGRPKRDGIQRDPRRVGKLVGDVTNNRKGQGDFDEYDVVIVGGGTAGCVLASRLSEDPNLRVLLLEAGDSVVKDPYVRIPSAFTLIMRTSKVLNLFTTLQPNSGGRRHYWPRATMLGGCTSINAQVTHYGNPSDYDEWAHLGGQGAASWVYKDFHRYFLKFENFVPSKAHPGVIATEHGADGPIEVGFNGHHSLVAQRFIESCTRAGIPLSADLNTPRGTLGVAKLMTYIDSRGRRVSTESAYLTSAVLSRPNLTVAVNAHVMRIVFDTTNSIPRAVGVEFSSSRDRRRFHVRAKKEVILAAGAVHSPHILMLSGIGPAAHLAEHNIQIITHSPGVGDHLMDHAVIDVAVAETSGTSLNFLKPTTSWHWIKRIYALVTYVLAGKGPCTTNVGEAAAFFRSADPLLFPPDMSAPPAPTEDSTSGPNAPDLELFVSPLGYIRGENSALPDTDMLGLHIGLLRPTSKGNLLLKSSDPFEQPLINPNYLSTEHDLAVLERGMAILTRIMRTAPLSDIIDHTATDKRLGTWLPTANPAEVREYIRKYVETFYHPTSTARMAPFSDGGVVDGQLRVHGVRGLRVVDASVFPTIVSGHTAVEFDTQAGPTIAVAEKASDLILQDLALRNST